MVGAPLVVAGSKSTTTIWWGRPWSVDSGPSTTRQARLASRVRVTIAGRPSGIELLPESMAS